MSKSVSRSNLASPYLDYYHLPKHIFTVVGIIGLIILVVLITISLFPETFYAYDPKEMVGPPLQPPTPDHRLGTNDIGQDLYSELIAGTRSSLFIGLVVSCSAVIIGVITGIVSGFFQGFGGSALVRLIDLILVLPFLPLVIILSAYTGPSQENVVLILIIFFWATPARIIRSRVLVLKNQAFIEAARALGENSFQIMRKHIWPGVRSIALIQLLLIASAAILAEASISFLGLGDPSAKSWGTMLYFAQASGAFLSQAWKWWVLPTGAMITLTVLSLVMVGYSLEDRFEPHLSGKR
jgi:peptide/nickel transport system permease protein